MKLVDRVPEPRALRRDSYRVFSWRGEPVVAISKAPPNLTLAALAQFHPASAKRRLFSLALAWMIRARLERLVGVDRTSPMPRDEDFGFNEWCEIIRARLEYPDFAVAVYWPRQRERHRVYTHLIEPSGRPVAFCKLAYGSGMAGLEDEIAALDGMRARGALHGAKVPKILFHDHFGACRYAVYEPLPRNIVAFRGDWSRLAPIVAEFADGSRRIAKEEVQALDWWRRFESNRECSSADFRSDVEKVVAEGIPVSRVHGDFTCANVLESPRGIWICDWEASSAAGPCRTDEIAYRLSIDYQRSASSPMTVRDELLCSLRRDGSPDAVGELVMALAFLCGRGLAPALSLARHWRGV